MRTLRQIVPPGPRAPSAVRIPSAAQPSPGAPASAPPKAVLQRGGAHEGATRVRPDGPAEARPEYVHPFGRVAPDWDFVIAQFPEPGQYRHFQFAWKAAGPETTGIGLRIGRGPDGPGVTVLVGDSGWPDETVLTRVCLGERPPAEWTTVRLDLWELTGGQLPVAGVSLRSDGGGALFDRLALGRTTADLPEQT